MPTASTIRSACAVVLALVLAGCSPQPAGSGRPGTDPAAADLIARTGSYYQDQWLLDRTESRLADACMAARGFPVGTAPSEPDRADEEWRPVLAERREVGYRLRESDRAETASPAARYVRGLSAQRRAQFQAALYGGPGDQAGITLHDGKRFTFTTRGCLADSRSRIYGDPAQAARVTYLPQDFHVNGYLTVRDQPAYRAVLAAWARCMAGRGHHYTSPAQAKQHLAAEYGHGSASVVARHEVAVAVADADCARQVGVAGTVESLLRDYAAALDPTDRGELDALAALRQQAVARARALAG